MRDLITQLAEAPQSFDLFQAMSILERSEPDLAPVGTSLGLDEALRLSADVTLSFMPSDVSAVLRSKREGPPMTLMTSALSLAGAHGPLPVPVTELLLDRRRERDMAGLEFLDIFNQRLLAFLYRGRKKHQLGLSSKGIEDAPVARCLDDLSGLGRAAGARAPGGEQAWLRHAGLQGPAPRSMSTLLALLSDRLKIDFGGRQFVGAWHPVAPSERAVLGRRRGLNGKRTPGGRRLGVDTTLGRRGWDQAAAIELHAFALPLADYLSLLPGGANHALLGWLATRHLQSDVEIRLCLTLQGPGPGTARAPQVQARTFGLGGSGGPRLGLTSWLHGSSSAPGSVGAVYASARFRVRMDHPVENGTA
jgi:type VI secretion system protein ImpH